MSRLVLDAGAFIAFERGDARVRALLVAARVRGMDVISTSPVVAQVWRDGRRQTRLASLVAATNVREPDVAAAKRAGELLRRVRADDVVDALVAGLARDGDTVLTSDARDLRALLTAAGVRATIVVT